MPFVNHSSCQREPCDFLDLGHRIYSSPHPTEKPRPREVSWGGGRALGLDDPMARDGSELRRVGGGVGPWCRGGDVIGLGVRWGRGAALRREDL